MRSLRVPLLIFCISIFPVFVHPVSAENDTYIPVHLDGYNTLLFNQEYPDQSLNMYSIIYGNPLDRFPFSNLSRFHPLNQGKTDTLQQSDSLFHCEAVATIGGETGELMFNIYEGIEQENRDHFTTFVTGCSFPHSPLDLYFGYRYLDHYSDRFDELWRLYEDITDNKMAFSSQGLAYEFTGGYILSGPVAATALKTSSYKHWGLTPFNFSPLFRSGYLLEPSLIFGLPKSTLAIDFSFDYHKDYYDHINFVEYTDEAWDITWQRRLQKGIIAQVHHQKDSRLSPSTCLQATLHDTVPNLFRWTLSGNVYGNLRPGASINVDYTQIPTLTINLNSGLHFIPKSREYTFWEVNQQVDYHTKKYETASLHASLRYNDTLFFPAEAAVWLHYNEKPLWETAEWTGGKVVIRQDTIANAERLTFGGKAAYRISLKDFSVTLWGNMAVTPKDREIRFSLPRDMGADIAYGRPESDSLYAAVAVENRDRTSLKYLSINENKLFEYTAPAQTSVSFLLRIPFTLPFFENHLRTIFQTEAGPIRFLKEQRVQEHPRGNLIGPAISVGIKGLIN